MKKHLFALVLLAAAFVRAQSPPQIPLTGNIGVPGSVAILGGVTVNMASDANLTLTANQWANKTLVITSGVSLTAQRNIVAPLNKGQEFNVENATTGGQAIQVIGATGTGISIPNGSSAAVFCDGTNYIAVSGGGGLPSTLTGIPYGNGASPATLVTTTQLNAAIGQGNGYVVLGDSIAASTGTTSTGIGNPAVRNGYTYLMQTPIGGNLLGGFNPGDQIADNVYKWNLRVTNPQGAGTDPMYVSELGTNDVTVYGSNTDKQNNFKAMMTAQLANLGMPQSSKTFAQACTAAGGFAADPATPFLTMGSIATTSGATLTCTGVTAPKASDTLYIVYQILDSNGGTFTVSVDGTPQTDPISGSTTFVNDGYNGSAILTQNGGTNGYAAARLTGFSAGAHNVVITVTSTTGTTNKVPIEWVGFAPVASAANNPLVFAVSPNAQNGTPNASLVPTYQGFISTIVSNLAADGLNETYVDTATALLNSVLCGNGNQATMFANCYTDTIHPNNTGHAVMANTIMAAMPPARLTGVTVSSRYQRLQNWTVSTATPLGSSFFNPAHFFDVNPYNITGSATSWVPGIKFEGNNGQLFWMGFQSQTGVTIGAPNGVGGFCLAPSGGGGIMAALPPTSAQCHFSWATNGAINFFGGSTSANGVTIQGQNVLSGTGVVYTIPGVMKITNTSGISATSSGTYSTTTPTGVSTNNVSPPFCVKGGVWNDSPPTPTPAFDGPCWQYVPVNPTPSGQGPRGYMKLQGGVTVGTALDLRGTFLANELGTSNVATLTATTSIATPAIVINGTNFSIIRGTTSAIGGSALTAGQCSSTGNISVPVSVGSGSVVNVTPTGGSPGDGYYWRGFPTGSGTINVQVCAVVAGTPSSQTYAYEINP